MECSRCNKEHMIGFNHSIFCTYSCSFNYWKQVPLNTFAGNLRPVSLCLVRYFIYLIYKDGELLVETDDLEYVRSYMNKNQECSVRDARTGKKVSVE